MLKIILLLCCFIAISTAYREYQCNFRNSTYFPTDSYYYTCVVNNVRVFNTSVPVFSSEKNIGHPDNTKIVKWDAEEGKHEMGTFTDDDVNRLKFVSANMSEIPRTIFEKFIHLEVLEVIGCGLRNIFQNSLKGALDLKILMAYENKLTSLFAYSFVNSPNLLNLDLSSNKIRNIHSFALNDLDQLEELSLAHNNLNIIEDTTFKPLVNLKRIWLNNNNMEILSMDLFASNVELEAIYLSNNKLTAISSFIFDQLPVLKFLFLADNPCVHKVFSNTVIAHNVNVKKELASCHREYKNIIPDEEHELKLRKILTDVGAAKMACETDRKILRETIDKAKELDYKLG